MASRINIGPEDGPYVAINEENGNLQLEDNGGNVVAEWDETNTQWDFANNTLNNVDALNSNSVSTEETNSNSFLWEGENSVYDFERIFAEQELDRAEEASFQVTELSDYDSILGFVRAGSGDDEELTLQFNGDDGTNYDYILENVDDASRTKVEADDKILLSNVNRAGAMGWFCVETFANGSFAELQSPFGTANMATQNGNCCQYILYDGSNLSELDVSVVGNLELRVYGGRSI